MEQKFILTAFGKDRPGIVADVSEIIYENGCNLEDSTMTRLADEFTLILLLSGQGKDLYETLSRSCRRLECERNISAFLRPVKGEAPVISSDFSPQTIQVEGMDQAGIVYKISKYLADKHINIENLTSKVIFSPQTGTALYKMKIETCVPAALLSETFDKDLDAVGDELNVDISVI